MTQRELIEQDHDIIVRLAVSHSVVKYWLYLRMFWHCRGGEDRLVRSKIAAIESERRPLVPKGSESRIELGSAKRRLRELEVVNERVPSFTR